MGFENGKLVRVVMRAVHNSDGDNQVNIHHYDLQDVTILGANNPQTLADLFRDNVVPPFRGLYTSAWTIQPVIVQQEKDPQNPNAGREEWVSGTAQAGTFVTTGDLLPRAVCCVVKHITDHIGRRHTGRTFVGGSFGEGHQADGVWGQPVIDVVNTYIAALPLQPDLVTGTSADTANLCVYSRTQRAADLDPYASHVKAHATRNQVHWLRSRVP